MGWNDHEDAVTAVHACLQSTVTFILKRISKPISHRILYRAYRKYLNEELITGPCTQALSSEVKEQILNQLLTEDAWLVWRIDGSYSTNS